MSTVSPSTEIALNFVGPFSFVGDGRSLFESPVASSAGVYLWTIKQRSDNTHLIHYVGETTSFASRHREHLIQILGLNYGIIHPEKAQDGICEWLWQGLWRDRSPLGPAKQIAAYQAIHQQMIRYLSLVNVFFAEVNTETQLRKHIEGCIGWNLRNNYPTCKALYPDDNHVGTMAAKNRGLLRIKTAEIVRGLDSEIPF